MNVWPDRRGWFAIIFMLVVATVLIVGNQLSQSWRTVDAGTTVQIAGAISILPVLLVFAMILQLPHFHTFEWNIAIALSVPASAYLYVWLCCGSIQMATFIRKKRSLHPTSSPDP